MIMILGRFKSNFQKQPTRGLRPLERWLCQCQLAAFGRSNGGFVSANSRPSAARIVALSVPTRGLRLLERWLCQCQLAAFGRSLEIFENFGH
ncbi:hypothetical protein Ddc_21405 [Ditylenchus destructor]|nr:hypothetical protein Ddc_21405 [Ditylenchus destructor]